VDKIKEPRKPSRSSTRN